MQAEIPKTSLAAKRIRQTVILVRSRHMQAKTWTKINQWHFERSGPDLRVTPVNYVPGKPSSSFNRYDAHIEYWGRPHPKTRIFQAPPDFLIGYADYQIAQGGVFLCCIVFRFLNHTSQSACTFVARTANSVFQHSQAATTGSHTLRLKAEIMKPYTMNCCACVRAH